MTRKLIIFGNGLGMSIDPNHFSLNRALNDIWDKDNFLTVDQKTLIQNCIDQQRAPEGEEELDILHRVVTACKSLNNLATANVHWLNNNGQSFPADTAKYIHKVATDLHNYDGELPKDFEEALVSFVKESRSHIATLNYDKLLYSSFIKNDVLNGYSGDLVDGMISDGFLPENLERQYEKGFGYYLHLHGSPLFVNRNGIVIKLSRDKLTLEMNEASEHIVLTHVKHKPSVIAASHVLSTYWDYLQFALSEAEEIILFGYSGLDDHLNKVIRPYLTAENLKVVEWNGAGEQGKREKYWLEKLGKKVSVNRLDNITNFTEW
tara:strand:+ start:774 stop:1733 length:960 start_codon:yes stop_codon:yes gene_type:complete